MYNNYINLHTNKVEFYEWFKKSNFQTEYEETGEYNMCFVVDLPKIIDAWLEHKMKETNDKH